MSGKTARHIRSFPPEARIRPYPRCGASLRGSLQADSLHGHAANHLVAAQRCAADRKFSKGEVERVSPSHPCPVAGRTYWVWCHVHHQTGGMGSPQGRERGDRAAPAGRGSGRHLYRHRRLLWPGVSETLIAKALHPYPAELVVATKGGLTRPSANRWVADCRPDHLRCACADGLRKLRLERIELYQLHAVDHRVPIEDSIGALVDLQKEGKIRHIGVSNVSERELARAGAIATIVSVRNCYNLRDRSSDRLIDICAGAGIAFIPWYPLAAGRLATPHSRLVRIAQSHGATPSQIALAWLLHRSSVMLPIPGTSSIAHLEENLAAASIRLSSDEFQVLVSL